MKDFNIVNYSQLFTLSGLFIDFGGAGILIYPAVKQEHFVDDDFIEKMDQKSGRYLQRKHLKERRLNFWGLAFLMIGFLFQFIGAISP